MERDTLYRLEAATGMVALIMLLLTLVSGIGAIWCSIAWAFEWAGANWLCLFGSVCAFSFAGALLLSRANGYIERKIAEDVARSIDANLEQYK